MSQEPTWVTAEQAVALNRRVVEVGDEPFGINIEGAIDAAVNRPQQHYYYGPEESYDDLVLLGAKLCVGVSQAQAFTQGNKRTALASMSLFFNLNGYAIVGAPVGELAGLILSTAAGDRSERMTEDDFALYLDPYVIEVEPGSITTGGLSFDQIIRHAQETRIDWRVGPEGTGDAIDLGLSGIIAPPADDS